jgi:O-antigen ligase
MALRAPWQMAAAAVLVAVPWLNPLASGPSPAVQPWLTTAACALVLWLLVLLWGGTPRLRLAVPAVLVVGWAVLSQLALWPEMLMLAAGMLLTGVAAGLAQDERAADGMQLGLLAAAAASALIGIAQYLGFAEALAPLVNAAQAGEAYANVRQPNLYATLCWIGASVVLWGSVRLPMAVRAGLIALLAAGCAASVSRTGLVQAMVLVVLAALWNGPNRRERLLLCGIGLLAYFTAAVALPHALQALSGEEPARTLWARLGGGDGCASRLVLWSNVLQLIAQRPLAGWGWGELDFAHYANLYAGPRFCDILDNAHNLPLHAAVELGVPAALAIALFALAWAWRQQPWREQQPRRQFAWAIVAIVLLHSLLEYPLWYGPFQVAFGAALGWLLPHARPVEVQVARQRGAALAGVLLLASGYAAWDYVRVSQIYLPPEQRRAAWSEDTLQKVRSSWLFAGQARFAEVTLSTVTRDNAAWMHDAARRILHYSPEPRVIERVIESATMLGRDDEAVLHLARYRAAFPREHADWRASQLGGPRGADPQR